MQRWLTLSVALCLATAMPLTAQHAAAPVPQAGATTAQPGPRLQPEFQRVQPAFANRNASAAVEETHTIRMTTLVLILVIVIAVLLIAK